MKYVSIAANIKNWPKFSGFNKTEKRWYEEMYSCFGDSITKGVPGVSYLKYLDNKQNFKNYGI